VAFFKYSLVRGLLFLAFFLLAYFAVHLSPLTSALAAALCAFVVSFFLLRKQREGATAVIARRFAPNAETTQSVGAVADADAEDALVDANPDVWVDADRASRKPHSQPKD
jgi:hypothetical protein